MVIIISEDGYGDIKTPSDVLRLDQRATDMYYTHLLNLLNSGDVETVKKAHDELMHFGELSAKLLESEVMAGFAKQLAVNRNRDLISVKEFDSIKKKDNLLLRKKINMFREFHDKVMFQNNYD